MYNAKHLEEYIEKINKEAEAAASAVFDKHLPEFRRKVLAQMKDNDKLYLVNGSAYFKGRGDRVGEKPETDALVKFAHTIASIQYLEQRASFSMWDFEK
mgnify:FL=1